MLSSDQEDGSSCSERSSKFFGFLFLRRVRNTGQSFFCRKNCIAVGDILLNDHAVTDLAGWRAGLVSPAM